MATLVFGSIGTALGGPLGGAIGAMVGRQADRALFGAPGRHGPRLREMDVTLSTYGQPIPRVYGRMRTAGAAIWATELQEHADTLGASKGQPGLTTYSYTANLAVALSSRRIQQVGRIWADGKLLRGAAGDLKVGGTLRVYMGSEEQPADPLLATAEGETRCPAFRGLAYVVFEGLELATFGNRVPALTFEVIADESARLTDLLQESLPGCEVHGETGTLAGITVEDSLDTCLAQFQPVLPIVIDAASEAIVVRMGERGEALQLGESAASVANDAFASATGASRRRTPRDAQPTPVLRYYDVERDYQPGTQHAAGRAGLGQAEAVELPAALQGAQARHLIEALRRRRDRTRDQIAWRTCTLDGGASPGVLVRLPQRPGTWRVETWEWREAGVELELSRVDASPSVGPAVPADGAFPTPPDRPAAQTRLVAFELPWNGTAGEADRPRTVAAVGANGSEWPGAALFVDHGDGQLWPIGRASRAQAVVGVTRDILAPASPLVIDRASMVMVALASSDQALATITLPALAQGGNLALLGNELIQFAKAEPLGAGVWRLSHLLRGCAGTEAATIGHEAGEAFALADARLTPLDHTAIGAAQAATVLAMSRGDPEPVSSPLLLAGAGARPLAPVHGRAIWGSDGSLHLEWTRRARGGWSWNDGVDVPLAEESERYVVTFRQSAQETNGSDAAHLRRWTVSTSALALLPADIAALGVLAPTGLFHVHQQGTHALSLPLFLARLG